MVRLNVEDDGIKHWIRERTQRKMKIGKTQNLETDYLIININFFYN
jgi:hypothetical protein